jgi:hypothetical protein
MMINLKRHRIAGIYFWKGKAYLPSEGIYKGGPRIDMEPVQIVDVQVNELTSAATKKLTVEPVQLPQMSSEERKSLLGTIPRVTGARSWNQLYKEALHYIIEAGEEEIHLLIPSNDTSQGWTYPRENRKTFSLGTDLSVVIRALLEDLTTRSKDRTAG